MDQAKPMHGSTAAAGRFLRACRRQPTDATPIWLMRQAGRYMPAYRRVRQRHSLLDIVRTPELACEVTLQPVDAFRVDAAIVFADILPLLEGMGLGVEFTSDDGPRITKPLRSTAEIDALTVVPAEQAAPFTLEAVRLVRQELDGRGIPLIGFSGAPFTLASYAIEGGGSRDLHRTKLLMASEPTAWKSLMSKLGDVVGHYLLAQARAGAQVLQLFDSWVGALGPEDYRGHVLPYSRRALQIAAQAGVPVIHFGVNTHGILELVGEAGGDVVGVDWRVPLDHAWRRLGPNVAVQGNLDPVMLLAPWPELERRARIILDQVAGRPGHIFNLGHGVLPQTPPDNVARLVDLVHSHSSLGSIPLEGTTARQEAAVTGDRG
jgi:uroporphyrinogen decarboxylase